MTSEEIITRMGEIEQRAAEIEANLETPEADLDALNEEARQLVTEKAQLEEQLNETGWVEEYQNGENQKGMKKSAAADVHISLTKNLNAIIKQLLDLVPPARKQSKLDELMNR